MRPSSSSRVAIALVGAATAQTVPTVHIPLNLKFGTNHKVSTNLLIPFANETIEVVYDQGSENFFLFGPGSIANWGDSTIGLPGPCNESVPAGSFYNYTESPTATAPVDHSIAYVYGGADKIYSGSVTVNDTFAFSNDAETTPVAVDDVRTQIVDFLVQRFNDPTCQASLVYDLSILGVSPFYNNASNRVTAGPHVRQDLLERGVISAATQSLWFDEAPADAFGTYTGGGLWGGVDHSKYTGDLVKVNAVQPARVPGYYTAMPTVTANGVVFNQTDATEYCQLDSGTHDDTLPIPYTQSELFRNVTGIVISPKGYWSWPGNCSDIPATATIDLTFAGAADGESITIKVPFKAYVRADNYVLEEGYCGMSVSVSGCLLGAPFATASFFAADDEAGEIALAQGGVSKRGSGVDEASVTVRIS